MKVLWITSAYPSDEYPSSGVFHETQVQALIQAGINVTVISPIPRNLSFIRYMRKQYRVKENIPFMYTRKGVTIYRPNYLALPGQLRWAQPDKRIAAAILDTMSNYDIKADVIHAHFAMPSGGAARLISKQKELPWVLTLHGSDVNIYPHYSTSSRNAFIHAVKDANHVLAVDAALQKKAKEMTGRDSTVLPIGINLTQFHQQEHGKKELRRKLQLPENKKLIVFVGRLTEAKGVFELAHSLALLPDEIAVVYIGDGPAKEKLKRHPELNSRLFLTGQIANEKVKEYLQASDVFTLPSYSEGMPTVVIEALALKIPVISTAVGGVPELFGEYRNYLIERKSVSSLVERIKDVLYQNQYTAKAQQDLFEHIQKNYRVEQNAVQLMKVYTEMMESTV